jgi:hypothetical protein
MTKWALISGRLPVRLVGAIVIGLAMASQPVLADSLALIPKETSAVAVSPGGFLKQLQLGELVRLRSGSPLMTIGSIQGENATCVWATEYGQIASGTFPIAALTAVGGPGGPTTPRPERAHTYHPCPSSVGRNECLG